MIDIRRTGFLLQPQMREVFPNDFSRHELNFSPVRTATLPYVSPKGYCAHLKYGEDRFTNHLFRAHMRNGRDVLQVEGIIPNEGPLREYFRKFSSARDAFSMQFTFSRANAAELVADARLATAVGIELVSSMLDRLDIPDEEKRVCFGNPHYLEWKNIQEAVRDLDDPQRTVLSSYRDKIVLETKRGASVTLMGKKWLIGRQQDDANSIYIAQEGSDVWWKLVTSGEKTELIKLKHDDEDGANHDGIFVINSYAKTQRGWPIWIADKVSGNISSDARRHGRIHLPVTEWQKADDFDVTVLDDDKVNVSDNSNPAKMPDHKIYAAFDPILNARLKPEDQGKGAMVNGLASLDNILLTRRHRGGIVGRDMQDLTESILERLRRDLVTYNGNSWLADELTQALEREGLKRKRKVENIRIESSTFGSQMRHILHEIEGVPEMHPVELRFRNASSRFLRLQPYKSESLYSQFSIEKSEEMSERLTRFFLEIMGDPDTSYAGLGDFTIRDYKGKRTRQAQLYNGKRGIQICTMVPEQLELQTAVIPKPDNMQDLLVHPVITIMAVKGNKIVTGRLFNGTIYPPVNDGGTMLPLNELTDVGSYLHYDLSHLQEFFG